ncbi:bacteriophage CI repressor [Vibrio harveyi]|uniref:hypothetical protein n=1 Tax=Vibrio harveyi TaxID=669 RepID=UPI000D9A7575|nr:hypothetical protein [Vibrio harveyi]GBL02610.1 bacteriophage CI repressor [Vibrio harveyi]
MSHSDTKRKEFNPKIKEQICGLGERLRIAIAPMSQRAFAKAWKGAGSFVSINNYVNGKSTPGIHDLIAIAQLANEDILWLLTGQNYTDNHWLQSNQCVELCLDDAMSPTLSINTPVVLEKLTPDSHLPNGIYCLESSQGRIFRRLQWDEEKQGFWLLCDNERYKPQLCQSPQVVGKAISALSPIT